VRAKICVDRAETGCADVAPGAVALDRTVDGAAQAWAQHLQTALGAHLAADRLPSDLAAPEPREQ